MFFVVITMLAILLVAGAVVVYVAFPHRGEPVPAAPWLGDAMARAAEALPTLQEEGADDEAAGAGPALREEHPTAGPGRR